MSITSIPLILPRWRASSDCRRRSLRGILRETRCRVSRRGDIEMTCSPHCRVELVGPEAVGYMSRVHAHQHDARRTSELRPGMDAERVEEDERAGLAGPGHLLEPEVIDRPPRAAGRG